MNGDGAESGQDRTLGDKFRLRELEGRADDMEDILRQMDDMLTAWKSGKLLVKFILMAGALIVAIGGAWATIKGLVGLSGPHP